MLLYHQVETTTSPLFIFIKSFKNFYKLPIFALEMNMLFLKEGTRLLITLTLLGLGKGVDSTPYHTFYDNSRNN